MEEISVFGTGNSFNHEYKSRINYTGTHEKWMLLKPSTHNDTINSEHVSIYLDEDTLRYQDNAIHHRGRGIEDHKISHRIIQSSSTLGGSYTGALG